MQELEQQREQYISIYNIYNILKIFKSVYCEYACPHSHQKHFYITRQAWFNSLCSSTQKIKSLNHFSRPRCCQQCAHFTPRTKQPCAMHWHTCGNTDWPKISTLLWRNCLCSMFRNISKQLFPWKTMQNIILSKYYFKRITTEMVEVYEVNLRIFTDQQRISNMCRQWRQVQ